ncbi:type II toxin-antitoxin system RelE/ParE family toxin [Patescibacteria group bacterium]|nr:type II toxin-antitoxin system RelE/ParE family toxin [Candidatus Falkowbacteria bacterium]MBU3906261.1 type II toxin-antitoxin system RelE/ParE family toxin [Patescibacteria group bacterium]MCG2697893.1 type II toxin-antitoxin system RelE/ParE family toxin [Candidatus Parcubacteria bacterium]MBU4015712.1 type II toxin-antitoxin system RelE/ParE family toxin [Patescibacteria group bacterium]MBU4026890.1 type II toxin-antitoxin system RelE/ParE family toxin [Patescibacteria group bacterium]
MIKWTFTAKNDLEKIGDYIKRDSLYYSVKVLKDILEKSKILDKFPNIGRVVPEINNQNTRELIIYSYRMIYKVSGRDVEILTLVHNKRNFQLDNKQHDRSKRQTR